MRDERIIAVASFLIMLIVCGSWFSFPIFVSPLTDDFSWDRTSISAVISLGLIISGVSLPFIGRLIDKFGPKKVIFVASVLLGISLLLKGIATNLLELAIFHGILGAIGYAGGALIANTALISRSATKKMMLALSFSQSGLPLGQQLFVPLAAYLMTVYDWRIANITLGIICLLLVPAFLLVIVKSGSETNLNPAKGETKQVKSNILKQMRSKPYLLAIILYFCCGFTDIAVASHITPFAYGTGISEFISANLFGMIGGLTWIGTLLCGFLAERFRKGAMLVGIYAVRNVSLIVLLYACNISLLLLFVVLFGLTYFSMVPLISVWLREMYGEPSLGGLFGTLSLIHALGASSGTYLNGFLFDMNGNYQLAFILAFAVSLIATLCAFLIQNKI